jgi:predicted kinase
MSLILKGRQVNAHIVSRTSRVLFGNIFLENAGNCTLSIQMQSGKHSVNYATEEIVD